MRCSSEQPEGDRRYPILVSAGLKLGETKPIRILVVDKDARVRSALQNLLRLESDTTAVHGCGDIEEMASKLASFQPDLILLDWELPGRPSAALMAALQGIPAMPKVIVLSVRPEAESAALAAGADAFVSKGDSPERLLDAVHTLSLG